MSTRTTDSVSEVRRQRSRSVRKMDVAGRPRQDTTSSEASTHRRICIPARVEIPASRGAVACIGLHGSTSSPCSHAAVSPENAAPLGKRALARLSVSSTSTQVACRGAQSVPTQPVNAGFVYKTPTTSAVQPSRIGFCIQKSLRGYRYVSVVRLYSLGFRPNTWSASIGTSTSTDLPFPDAA